MPAMAVGRTTAVDHDALARGTAGVPGKQTLTQQLPASHELDVSLLAELAGERVTDGGGYVFEIQADATFTIVHAPTGRGVGVTIAQHHAAWPTLFALAMTLTYCRGADGRGAALDRPLPRAPRPSSPAVQMASLLAAARGRAGAHNLGRCYHYIKDAIVLANGYGDILDINADPRFEKFRGSAVQFHDAVDQLGPAAFGLEQLSCTLADAPAGSLVVTKGNGRAKLSVEYGDIAVVEGTQHGVTYVYNDARTPFSAAPKDWASGGTLEGTLLAIYVPIARP